MSKNNYNPIPPRVWSRVENPCVFIVPGSDYELAFIPLTGQTLSQAQADYETKQIYKGNILQYKGNSARLTKTQKYSQLARMAGPNRTKVFATQTQTYSNPNTTGLLRQNFNTYPFPNQIPGAPNNISGPFAYGILNPNDCSSNTIIDGGTLVCGTFANPCSGEIIKRGNTSATICSPASASNVPGPSVLCWNNKVQTWFPRQRYFMNNSTDKWPVNYKGLVSAVTPTPPILTFSLSSCSEINLSWTQPPSCLPITSYDIYVNNILYVSVPSNVNTYSFLVSTVNLKIYIKSVSNLTTSNPSNIIDATIFFEIVIINTNNTRTTNYFQGNTRVVVIESTLNPTFGSSSTSTGTFFINSNCEPSGFFPLNILLVGAGGGGASGYSDINGGGGGGSGAINFISNFVTSSGTVFNIGIGVGGGGRTPGNGGGGNSSGNNGQNTYLYFNSTQIISDGGGGGLGVGTTTKGGGFGGNAIKNSEPFGPTYSGYGGSSGGGAKGSGNISKAGDVGTGYTSNGNSGLNGGSSNGGNGGSAVFPNIVIPIIGTIYFGGAAGGAGSNGGGAGSNGSGGSGGSSSSNGGQNATTYGAGGGGGGSSGGGTGGNGANGAIIFWWTIP